MLTAGRCARYPVNVPEAVCPIPACFIVDVEVLDVPGTWVALVSLRVTHVLPGVPRLFRSIWVQF